MFNELYSMLVGPDRLFASDIALLACGAMGYLLVLLMDQIRKKLRQRSTDRANLQETRDYV